MSAWIHSIHHPFYSLLTAISELFAAYNIYSVSIPFHLISILLRCLVFPCLLSSYLISAPFNMYMSCDSPRSSNARGIFLHLISFLFSISQRLLPETTFAALLSSSLLSVFSFHWKNLSVLLLLFSFHPLFTQPHLVVLNATRHITSAALPNPHHLSFLFFHLRFVYVWWNGTERKEEEYFMATGFTLPKIIIQAVHFLYPSPPRAYSVCLLAFSRRSLSDWLAWIELLIEEDIYIYEESSEGSFCDFWIH